MTEGRPGMEVDGVVVDSQITKATTNAKTSSDATRRRSARRLKVPRFRCRSSIRRLRRSNVRRAWPVTTRPLHGGPPGLELPPVPVLINGQAATLGRSYRSPRRVINDFRDEVVAGLDDEWRMSRSEILAWLDGRRA